MSAIDKAYSSRSGPAFPRLMSALALCLGASLAIQPAMRAQAAPAGMLSLSQAIDLGLQHNRDLKLHQLAITDSEQQRNIERSKYFPQITNESKISHVTAIAGVVIPSGAFGTPSATGPIPAQTLTIGQGASTSYTSGTQLTQPITQMLRLIEENRAATTDVNVAKIHLTEAEINVAIRVRELYFGLLLARLNLESSHDEVIADQAKNQEAREAVANGRVPDASIVDTQADLFDAKQTELKDRIEMRKLTSSLNDFLGLPLSSVLQLDPEPPVGDSLLPTREECLRIAREHNPSIRADQQEVIKAKSNLAVAKSAYIPDVNGLARYSYQSGVPLYVHNFGTFGIDLNYDLFDGGRRVAEVKSARIHLSQAQVSLDHDQDDVTLEVETAYDRIEQLQDLVQMAEQRITMRLEAARDADREAEQGTGLASKKSDAHAKTIAARASLLQAVVDLSVARGEMERLIGRLPR